MVANEQTHDSDANLPDTKEIERARLLMKNRNYEEALAVYLRLAQTQWGQKNYCRIGWMYELGRGTEKDLRQAEYWYERAAKAGIPAGYYYLAGMRYREGRHDEMRRLMEHAAEQGYLPAMFELGRAYRFGIGGPIDRIKAYEYYERAAAQGHLFAQRAIAEKFIRGEHGLWGIPKGCFMVAKLAWKGFKLKLKDPSNDRLRWLG
jgi:TPR repeat protein